MKKALLFRVIALLVALAAAEGIVRLGVKWIPEPEGSLTEPAYSATLTPAQREIIQTRILANKTDYIDFSAELGWTIKPNGQSPLYHANSHGFRGDRDYALQPDASVLRIAAFGDSYTHGDDVSNTDTWESQLERMHARLEVLNFGVGGYGTDQALLRYEREGDSFHPRVVLLGFLPENIARLVSVFRPFYYSGTGILMSKPRFAMRSGEFALLPNPIQTRESYAALLTDTANEISRLGEHDYFYQRSYHYWWGDRLASVRLVRVLASNAALRRARSDDLDLDGRFNPDSEAFKILTRIVARFRDAAITAGSRPIVVILPDQTDLQAYLARGPKRYDPLLAFLQSQSMEFIDLMEAFVDYARDKPVPPLFTGRHYSPLGNGVVAGHLANYLTARGLVSSVAPPTTQRHQ